jgi:hypothetical protein
MGKSIKERIPQMAAENKSLTNKDGNVTKLTEFATMNANSVDDLVNMFGEQGVAYSTGEETNGGYRFISADEKVAFFRRVIGKRLFVVRWEFRTSSTGDYVTMHMVIDGAGKFIANDSSKTGMYGQLSDITSTRQANNVEESRSMAGALVQRGVKENAPYEYDTTTNRAIGKDSDVPKANRAWAKPTFRFEF